MTADTQRLIETVREALNFGYGGDPNYRPLYEEGVAALDALAAALAEAQQERDELREERLDRFVWTADDGPLVKVTSETQALLSAPSVSGARPHTTTAGRLPEGDGAGGACGQGAAS